MRLASFKAFLLIAIMLLSVCIIGCSPADHNNNTANSSTSISKDDPTETEGKAIECKDAEIYIPINWSEEQSENSVSLASNDNSVTGIMMYSPVEGAPDHPYAIANSAKYVFTQFCAKNGFTNNVEINYKVVNGYPCYYTNGVVKEGASKGVLSNIYVLGLKDYTIIVVADYLEREQGMADAVFSTLTTKQSASDYITGVSNSLDADSNPAELYNLEQDIKEQIVRDAEANKAELKKQEPVIGMTEYEVVNSAWGEPKDRNVTMTKYGTHEQWVYAHDRYIYFDDGVVSAIQK